jgi:protein-S-isoprenylcysteine O-methyltransferase Ste14
MPKSYSDFAARVRVPLGIALGVVYIVFARPTSQRLFWGSLLAFTGLLLRASAAGHLEKNKTLATGGPYAFVRHPLYLGSMLAGTGYCIAGGRWWFFVLLAVFFSAIYWPVIGREERHLRDLFRDEYPDYARRVPFLLPRLGATRATRGAPSRFRWMLYWKNREYEAFLAFLTIVAILSIKVLLGK